MSTSGDLPAARKNPFLCVVMCTLQSQFVKQLMLVNFVGLIYNTNDVMNIGQGNIVKEGKYDAAIQQRA